MDTVKQGLLEGAPPHFGQAPLARAEPQNLERAKPEMNRADRVIFTAYLAMIALIMVFLVVAGLGASLGA
jgi:hypothetical protein